MPVRKIPKNYVGVTGAFSSGKNGRALGFESLLERDHMVLLEFDPEVESFEEQPVRIPIIGKNRRPATYVPDVLIRYRLTQGGRARKPVLAEVKHQRDLDKNKDKYAPKFAAATKFAAKQGWEFRVVSDREIRTPRLPNLKFLREYHLISPDAASVARVLDAVRTKGGATEVNSLLDEAFDTDDERLQAIPVIWHLVATGVLHADLDHPITNRTVIGLPTRGRR